MHDDLKILTGGGCPRQPAVRISATPLDRLSSPTGGSESDGRACTIVACPAWYRSFGDDSPHATRQSGKSADGHLIDDFSLSLPRSPLLYLGGMPPVARTSCLEALIHGDEGGPPVARFTLETRLWREMRMTSRPSHSVVPSRTACSTPTTWSMPVVEARLTLQP